MLRNFVVGIAGVRPNWTPATFVETTVAEIARAGRGGTRDLRAVGRRRLGGGRDARASGHRRPADLHLRRPRPDAQARVGAAARHVRARPRHAAGDGRRAGPVPAAAGGRGGPRGEAQIIGDEFIRVFEEEAAKLGQIDFLTQGTLYPDVIESTTAETKAAQKIKTHHNVGGLPPDLRFRLIEPLRYLFKDEVRKVGLELGLPEAMVQRQPFPGPGLAIRIIGEVTAERLDTLREADWIVIDEIKAAGLYRSLWQSLRHPHAGALGGRDGRRPDLRQRRGDPRGDQRRRHDRRLGALPYEVLAKISLADRERGAGRQPRRLRHQLEAAGDHRVGGGRGRQAGTPTSIRVTSSPTGSLSLSITREVAPRQAPFGASCAS